MNKKTSFLQALELTREFTTIKRSVGYRKHHRENDAEHSYQVAISCWVLNHDRKLGLSDEKILKMALVHDLVEVYAGDVDAHGASKKKHLNKKEQEQKALKKIQTKFPELTELTNMITEYDKKDSKESKFVSIVDKITPVHHVYHVGTTYYKDNKVTTESWIEWLHKKTDYQNLPKDLKEIVDEITTRIQTEYKSLFYNS